MDLKSKNEEGDKMLGKKKIRILIVSYAYPPVSSPGAMRMFHFANDLSEMGYDVSVLKCSNPYSSMIGESLPNKSGITFVDVIDLIDKTSFSGHKGNSIKKTSLKVKVLKSITYPDRDFSWIPSVLMDKRLKESRYDIVLGSYPNATNLILAAIISRRSNARLVLDMRDLWTRDHSFSRKRGLKRWLDKILEKKVMKSAGLILNVSDFNSGVMRGELSRMGCSAEVVTIRNGFDFNKIKELRAERRSKRSDAFEMAYAGSFYAGERDPSDLFAVLKKLLDEGVVSANDFALRVFGATENQIVELVKQFEVEDLVIFEGPLPQDELFKILLNVDCLWALTRKAELAKGEMTTKVFEYVGLGKPIICQSGPGFEMQKVMSEVGNAYFIEFGDVYGLEMSLVELIEKKRAGALVDYPISERFSRVAASRELSRCLIG